MGRASRLPLWATAGWLVVALSLTGCVAPKPIDVPVAVYGRNATLGDAWFAALPLTDPLWSVGFGRDIGVACWLLPEGAQIVMLDHAPLHGPTNVIHVVADVTVQPAQGRREFWVDVAKDGSMTAGSGLPPWWPPGGGAC